LIAVGEQLCALATHPLVRPVAAISSAARVLAFIVLSP
jgi:hypothetical protein